MSWKNEKLPIAERPPVERPPVETSWQEDETRWSKSIGPRRSTILKTGADLYRWEVEAERRDSYIHIASGISSTLRKAQQLCQLVLEDPEGVVG